MDGDRPSRNWWIMTAMLALATGGAFAEMPSWEDVRDQVFLTRHHWWAEEAEPEGRQFSGIWVLAPDSGALRRVRPLLLSWQWSGMYPRNYTGYGHVLATIDDRLVVEMWPHHLEYEAGSWRLLRRYPPAADFSPVGWAVMGPILSEAAAPLLGLEPGIYGFGTCGLKLITRGTEGIPRACESYQYPGWEEALRKGGDYSVLLHRRLDPFVDEVSFAADVTPYEYHDRNFPALSFDREGGGFRRAGPKTIEFLSVTDGVVQPASIVHELDFPSLGDEWDLFALHLHPASRKIFGVAEMDNTRESVFFALNDDLSPFATYDLTHTSWAGWPISITSFDDLPESNVQTVPVVSRTKGRYGTYWSTDLWLYNPSGEPMTVHVRRVVAPQEEHTMQLPARGSLKVTDALSWVGGGPEGDGTPNDALVLTSPYRWGEQLVAVSRTFNTDASGGTYGQAVPAVPSTVGYTNHLPYDEDGSIMYNANLPTTRAANLVVDRRVSGQYRHNLGIVNDGDEPVRITLRWGFTDGGASFWGPYEPPGMIQTVDVAPHSVSIVNVEKQFPEGVRDHWPPRVGVFGDRPVLLWLSMVDNLTGDATFVPFTNYTQVEDGFDGRSALPVIAHNPGKKETFWVTDLYGAQGEAYQLEGRGSYDEPPAYFYPQESATECGGAAINGEITTDLVGDIGMPIDVWLETLAGIGFMWTEGRARNDREIIYSDAVHLFSECEGELDVKGGLEILTQSWTTGFSRTYTSRDDGGTYGSMLPFYPPNGWPVQHFAGIEVGSRFRINVGLFNGDHDHTITHRLILYRADGSEAASVDFDLAPLELRQQSLAHILGLPAGSLEDGTYGLTVIPLDDDETGIQGRSWAFVSLVDNTTGDPTNWW